MGYNRVTIAPTPFLLPAPQKNPLDSIIRPPALAISRGLKVRMEINPSALLRQDTKHVLLTLSTYIHGQQRQSLVSLIGRIRSFPRSQTGREVEIDKFQNAQYLPPYVEFAPKQIRERYLNYLRPEKSKEEFSLEEDMKICKFVMEHGKHWRRMEEVLPGRAEGCIKGRYYGKLQGLMIRGKEQS